MEHAKTLTLKERERGKEEKEKGKKNSSVGEHFSPVNSRRIDEGDARRGFRNFHDISIPCPTQTQGTDKRDVLLRTKGERKGNDVESKFRNRGTNFP